jgi:hypothetical protein
MRYPGPSDGLAPDRPDGKPPDPEPVDRDIASAAAPRPLFEQPEDCEHEWASVYADVRTISRCNQCGEIDWS